MTEFYTVKKIDNSRVVRTGAPRRLRECARVVALGALLAAFVFLYAWQHFQSIQLNYQVEQLKADQAQAVELNQQLKLEVASLRSPGRIDTIARQELGLTAPVPGQVAPIQGPSEPVVAQVQRATAPALQ
jgi:cell division protein FtsL